MILIAGIDKARNRFKSCSVASGNYQYKKLIGEATDLSRKFAALSSDGQMGIPLAVKSFFY